LIYYGYLFYEYSYSENYINHVLINEIGDVVEHHKWLSFILICSGIEFLGGCIDTKEINLNAGGRSKERFNTAILSLFPPNYHQYVNTGKGGNGLYAQLRCGVNHVTIPGLNVVLSERKSQIPNLSIWNERLVLIAEDIYDDFKDACNKVIGMLEDGAI
jgi:hypothetical protein